MTPIGTGWVLKLSSADSSGSGSLLIYTIEELAPLSALIIAYKTDFLRVVGAAPAGPVGTVNTQAVIYAADSNIDFNTFSYFVASTFLDEDLFFINEPFDDYDYNFTTEVPTATQAAGDDSYLQEGAFDLHVFLSETKSARKFETL